MFLPHASPEPYITSLPHHLPPLLAYFLYVHLSPQHRPTNGQHNFVSLVHISPHHRPTSTTCPLFHVALTWFIESTACFFLYTSLHTVTQPNMSFIPCGSDLVHREHGRIRRFCAAQLLNWQTRRGDTTFLSAR